MFKYWHVTLMYSLIYVVNLVFITIAILNLPKKKLIVGNIFRNAYFLILVGVIVLSGLPPFSFFFFKIFIINSTKSVYLNTLLFYCVNTVVLYYYISFVAFFVSKPNVTLYKKIIDSYSNKYHQKKKILFEKIFFFWWFFVNTLFVIFFEYVNSLFSCLLCLIMSHR